MGFQRDNPLTPPSPPQRGKFGGVNGEVFKSSRRKKGGASIRGGGVFKRLGRVEGMYPPRIETTKPCLFFSHRKLQFRIFSEYFLSLSFLGSF